MFGFFKDKKERQKKAEDSWNKWVQETDKEIAKLQERNSAIMEQKKEDARAREEEWYKMEKKRVVEMQQRYNFSIEEEPVRIALERLEGLKVNDCRYEDYASQDSFDAIWRSVLHEVDLYEEGEESMLNKNSCRGAKNWLKSFSHLCKTVKIPEEYKFKEG